MTSTTTSSESERVKRALETSFGGGGMEGRRRNLVSIAAATASSIDEYTRAAVEHALRDRVHSSEIYEVILQSYLTGGFPRTINAFMIFREMQERVGDRWRPAPAGWDDPDTPEEIYARGEKCCRKVYADAFDALRERLTALSPDMFEWLLSDGYGKILGRPGLPAEDRELCLLSSLAVLGIERQIMSHVRGAANMGFTIDDIEDVIRQSLLFADENAAQTATRVLTRFRTRYAR